MCANDLIKPEKKGYMKLDLFKRIVNEISDYSQDIYLHHRGEPLLHPDIFEMIKYAKQKGLQTKMHTNATLLSEEKSLKLLESGLDFVSFSFDGYNKETYEKIRVNANFEETLSNIIRFLELKKKFEKNKPYTILQFLDIPGVKIDSEQKETIRERFHSLPLDEIREIAAHNWGGNVKLTKKSPDFFNRNKGCTFPWYSLTILYDGTVTPCPQDFMGEIELGNVRTESISKIWNGKKMIQLRKKMVTCTYNDLKPCNNCDRIMRETLFGSMIPKQNLLTFIKENTIGYKKRI
jgi:radical SAM protein with 4Fe4S-binding SPASM domain